jgi:hypothetical protein
MNGESPEERQQSVSRLENEIREILEKSDRPPSNVIKFKSRVERDRRAKIQSIRERISGTQLQEIHLLIAAVVLSAIGYFLGDASPALARIFAILSIVAFVLLYVRYLRRPTQGEIKTWRGRDIEFGPPRWPRR